MQGERARRFGARSGGGDLGSREIVLRLQSARPDQHLGERVNLTRMAHARQPRGRDAEVVLGLRRQGDGRIRPLRQCRPGRSARATLIRPATAHRARRARLARDIGGSCRIIPPTPTERLEQSDSIRVARRTGLSQGCLGLAERALCGEQR